MTRIGISGVNPRVPLTRIGITGVTLGFFRQELVLVV